MKNKKIKEKTFSLLTTHNQFIIYAANLYSSNDLRSSTIHTPMRT
jgi:hypothetical protein